MPEEARGETGEDDLIALHESQVKLGVAVGRPLSFWYGFWILRRCWNET